MANSRSSHSMIIMLCFLVLFSSKTFVSARTTPLQDDDDSEMMKMFEEWMIKYNRVHTDLEEKNRRFEVFKNNVELINAHNEVVGRKYDLATNKFADMTNEEFNAKYTGYRPRPKAQNGIECRPQIVELHDDIPPSIDWRQKGAVTSVKDQNGCGSCWAFSTVAAMEGLIQIETGELIDLSVQELVDCDNLDSGCGGGLLDSAYTWIIDNKGLNSEKAYPYTGEDGECNEKMRSVSVANISGYECVEKDNEKALAVAVSKQPVVVAINANLNFQLYKGGVYNDDRDTCDAEHLNHGVTVVGYDALENGTSYWIVKNSWGGDWGEKGYIRMLKDTDYNEGLCGIARDGTYPVK